MSNLKQRRAKNKMQTEHETYDGNTEVRRTEQGHQNKKHQRSDLRYPRDEGWKKMFAWQKQKLKTRRKITNEKKIFGIRLKRSVIFESF